MRRVLVVRNEAGEEVREVARLDETVVRQGTGVRIRQELAEEAIMRGRVKPDVLQQDGLRHVMEIDPPGFGMILEAPQEAGCLERDVKRVVVDVAERCAGVGKEA